MILLPSGSRDVVDAGGMGQHFRFVQKRGRRDVRDHHAGLQAWFSRKKGWQTVTQVGIHQSLNSPFDFAAIALTDLMSISERRIERLVNPDLSYGLPAFLARKPGLQSGMMIAHVAAASLLNEAKVLAHPASIDNVPTSAGKEDHVSMGMTSAVKLRSIVENAENLLAIELLAAAEALEHRRPLKGGAGVERAFTAVRKIAAPLTQDRSLSADIARVG